MICCERAVSSGNTWVELAVANRQADEKIVATLQPRLLQHRLGGHHLQLTDRDDTVRVLDSDVPAPSNIYVNYT
jgi:hypothetical protein